MKYTGELRQHNSKATARNLANHEARVLRLTPMAGPLDCTGRNLRLLQTGGASNRAEEVGGAIIWDRADGAR